jgi:hypothetical protein
MQLLQTPLLLLRGQAAECRIILQFALLLGRG